jgi:hypothetical protein
MILRKMSCLIISPNLVNDDHIYEIGDGNMLDYRNDR